jgi:hypothetical protein
MLERAVSGNISESACRMGSSSGSPTKRAIGPAARRPIANRSRPVACAAQNAVSV